MRRHFFLLDLQGEVEKAEVQVVTCYSKNRFLSYKTGFRKIAWTKSATTPFKINMFERLKWC